MPTDDTESHIFRNVDIDMRHVRLDHCHTFDACPGIADRYLRTRHMTSEIIVSLVIRNRRRPFDSAGECKFAVGDYLTINGETDQNLIDLIFIYRFRNHSSVRTVVIRETPSGKP